MDMKDRKDVSVAMPVELNEAIVKRLAYGDSKSEWIREAIRQRIEQEDDDLDDIPKTPLEAHSN
jgi:metal-responsive CopG/Arc/MetJ family transcriptional regulator